MDRTGKLLVAINVVPTDALRFACIAREVVSEVQSLRKSSSLTLGSAVDVVVKCEDKKRSAFFQNAMRDSREYFEARIGGQPSIFEKSDVVTSTVIAQSKAGVLAHIKKEKFVVSVILTVPRPVVVEKSVLRLVKNDKKAAQRVCDLVRSMSPTAMRSRVQDGTLHVRYYDDDQSVRVVALTMGVDAFCCEGDRARAALKREYTRGE